jgi:hypothetical protein
MISSDAVAGGLYITNGIIDKLISNGRPPLVKSDVDFLGVYKTKLSGGRTTSTQDQRFMLILYKYINSKPQST